MVRFETVGWFLECWVDDKLIGTKLIDNKDREVVGYKGAVSSVIQEDLILQRGRLIKAGTTVKTLLFPLCGKLIKA